MAKTKNPFFSLGSRGTVGGVLTTQALHNATLIRSKPIPAYRRTLPQQYQRWLYEDYAYLWTQQSAVTQHSYTLAGTRFHLTGFQYWMKYNLTNLPDIAGWWKQDDNSGAVTVDSSRNENTGTIIGASASSGYIGRALYYDGINDIVVVPSSPSLQVVSAFTLETLVHSDHDSSGLTSRWLVGKDWQYIIWWDRNPPFSASTVFVYDGAWHNVTSTIPLPKLTTHHLAAVYDDPLLLLYINGTLNNSKNIGSRLWTPSANAFTLGMTPGLTWPIAAIIDNTIFYNRALDPTEILRHSLRRYPA